jgi:hypothetical protein
MVVRGRAKARLLMLAWEAVRRGVKSAASTPELDSFIVDRCTITMRRSSAMVALDGEAERIEMPLEYRVEKDILRIVGGAQPLASTNSGSEQG